MVSALAEVVAAISPLHERAAMTLLSTIHMAKNALFAFQTGIQVASNNVANADTPGYVREKMIVTTAPPQQLGPGIVGGTGVQVEGIVREVDVYLQERLRAAISDKASGEAQESIYVELESAIGELSENDLSTALSEFFGSLQDVLNQPEDTAVRNLAVLRGAGVTTQIRQLESRVQDLRRMTNERMIHAAHTINQLVGEIAKLNVQIVAAEQGGTIDSQAVGLRDKRDNALAELAQLVNIQVQEQASGAVNVFAGGDYLVFDGATQRVKTVPQEDHGLAAVEIRLTNTDARLQVDSGELAGLLAARDDILGGFLRELDDFTGSLIFAFNKLHASGQGLSGYSETTAEHRVAQMDVPLDEAGLAFTPVHGSFQVEMVNQETGLRTTHEVPVQLTGMSDDTTYLSLVASLDAIDGLSAQIVVGNELQMSSELPHLEFTFSHDTSGVLAALGINTFFRGTTASDVSVREELLANPARLAVSQSGIGHDTSNGELLAAMLTMPLDVHDGETLAETYGRWIGETSQASAMSQAVAEGFRAFHATLEAEHLGLSGVNLDEEAVNLMTFQRSYQAAAKVISTIDELLDVLVNL